MIIFTNNFSFQPSMHMKNKNSHYFRNSRLIDVLYMLFYAKEKSKGGNSVCQEKNGFGPQIIIIM